MTQNEPFDPREQLGLKPYYVPATHMEDDDMLVWSNPHFIIMEPGSSPDNDIEIDRYLYFSFTPPLDGIVTRLAQLNDFCVLLQNHSQRTGDELREEWHEYDSGRKRDLDVTGEDLSGIATTVLELQMDDWGYINRVIVRATCFVLLVAFLEKTLKALCGRYASTSPATKRIKSESTVNFLLTRLREDAHLQFETPEPLIEVLDTIRAIRNDFAHGDWDAVELKAGEIGLRDAFRAVSELLYRIEDGVSLLHESANL